MSEHHTNPKPSPTLGKNDESFLVSAIAPLYSENSEDFRVRELLQQYSLSGGKQTRAALGTAFCQALGIDLGKAKDLLQTGEMLHAATLVHDDVIDESNKRRGHDSLRAAINNKQAVLSGDYLLAKVIARLSQARSWPALDAMAHCLEEIVEGELLQQELTGQLHVSQRDLEAIATKKTAVLFEWSCQVAGFLEGDRKLLSQLSEFGRLFGLAFQMRDDILDFYTGTGKPRFQDLKEKRLNFVSLAILEKDSSLKRSWSWDPENICWPPDDQEVAVTTVSTRIESLQTALNSLLIEICPEDTPSRQAIAALIEKIGTRHQ